MSYYTITYTNKKTGRREMEDRVYSSKKEAERFLKLIEKLPKKALKYKNHRIKKVM